MRRPWVLITIGAIVGVVIAFLVLPIQPAWKRLASVEESATGRIWIVDVGEPRRITQYGVLVTTLADPVTFPADVLRVHDRFRCEGSENSVHRPLVAEWMDERGLSNNKLEEISVHTNLDGSVIVTCFAPGGRPVGST